MEKEKQVKRTYYEEAMRYIENAEETLKKSPKEDGLYTDLKYVKSAGGIAYAGVEIAAKWYIKLHDVKMPQKADVDEIKKALAKINQKVLNLFNSLYKYLHLGNYYNAENNIVAIKETMKNARIFIGHLKPYDKQVVYGRGGKLIAKITKDK